MTLILSVSSGLVALLTLFFMYKANSLLQEQNIKIEQQTFLQEAERRSSLVFLFSNIMDAVDREISEDFLDNNIRDLSPQLIGRIVALSHRLLPYRFLSQDKAKLNSRAYSPERGQLLVALLNSDLSIPTYNEIFSRSSFKYSLLDGVSLDDMYMGNLMLDSSSLRNVSMRYTNLEGSSLEYVNFENAVIYGANFKFSKMRNNNFTNASITLCEFNDVLVVDSLFIHQVKNQTGDKDVLKDYDVRDLLSPTKDYDYHLVKSNDVDYYEYCRCRLLIEDIVRSSPKISMYFYENLSGHSINYFSHTISPYGSPYSDRFEDGKDNSWHFALRNNSLNAEINSKVGDYFFDLESGKLIECSIWLDTVNIYVNDVPCFEHKYDKEIFQQYLNSNCRINI